MHRLHAARRLFSSAAAAAAAAVPGATRQARTPPSAAILTAAGALPFVWFAAQHSPDAAAVPRGDVLLARAEAAVGAPARALSAVLRAGDQAGVRRAFVGYGAVILSFLGAVHWGATRAAAPPRPALRYAYAVAPALLAWAALRAQDAPAAAPGGERDRLPHVMLAAGFFAAYAYDELAATRARTLPHWYTFIRTPATLVVVASCLGAAKLAAPEDLRRRGDAA